MRGTSSVWRLSSLHFAALLITAYGGLRLGKTAVDW
jgi:hypothetical protein